MHTSFASGGRKGMELNLSPHANVGRSLLKDVAECRFLRKSIAVATRDVKSASVSHAHFFASGGRKGDGAEFVPSCKCWPFPFKGCCRVSVFARNRLLLLPEM
ncbi:hypothetical protein CEXT_723691 [Caerostris extrusa]|uniref:Uncharacterized protein n=1 Tax=Caerostris extrusa TaxID=172846 RepID=A0AAV4M6P0_CAEEX|nr:hypothetical protein CEXT_723691 [Caerostris extrusa]